jgi:hypothetical protein
MNLGMCQEISASLLRSEDVSVNPWFILQLSSLNSHQQSMVKALRITPENGMTKILALVSTVAALAVLGTSGMAPAAGRDHRDGAATSTAATPAKQGLAAYNDQYRDVNARSKKSKSKKKH